MNLKSVIAQAGEVGEFLKQDSTIVICKEGKTSLYKIYDSRDYATHFQRELHFSERVNGLQRMKEIDDEINIDEMLALHDLKDIEQYCIVPRLGNAIKENIEYKVKAQYAKQCSKGSFPEKKQMSELDRRNITLPLFRDELCDKVEYIDWDRFLETSVMRANELIYSKKKLSIEQIEILKKILQVADKLIRRKTEGYNEMISSNSKTSPIEDIVLETEENENPENNPIGILQQRGIDITGDVTDEELDKIQQLKKAGILNTRDLVDLYLDANISLKQLTSMSQDLAKELTVEKLIQTYRSLESGEISEEKTERYFLLYRKTVLKDAEEKEKNALGELTVKQLGNNPERREILDLYKKGVLPLQTVITHEGIDIIYTFLESGSLKTDDIRRLAEARKIKKDYIVNLVRHGSLSRTDKFLIIAVALGREKQWKVREELYGTLGIAKTTEESLLSDLEERREAFKLDPAFRLQLLLALDDDSTFLLTDEGYAVVRLPEHGKIVFEKMFKKSKGVKIASGEPTYIIDEETFVQEELLTKGEKLDRVKLRELSKQGRCDIYYHSKNWENTIADTFNARNPNKYNAKHIERINDIIGKIKATIEIR